MYALNIIDLARYGSSIRACMIASDIGREPIEVGRESAVRLLCAEAQGLAIIAVLREIDHRATRRPLRVYRQGPRGGWKRA